MDHLIPAKKDLILNNKKKKKKKKERERICCLVDFTILADHRMKIDKKKKKFFLKSCKN